MRWDRADTYFTIAVTALATLWAGCTYAIIYMDCSEFASTPLRDVPLRCLRGSEKK